MYEKKSRGGCAMIYNFIFSNFRSYKNEAKLDFTAKPISEYTNTLISVTDDELLLPVCAIYGPNGGGKSSVLIALKTLREIVLQPMLQMAFMKKKNEKLADATIEELQESLKIEQKEEFYYKWDDESLKKPTDFCVVFQVSNTKYCYELKIFDSVIQEENLYSQQMNNEAEAVFERDEEGVYLCPEIEGTDIDRLNESLPLLSYIAIFKDIEIIDKAASFFLNMQIINFDNPTQDRKIFVKSLEMDKKRIINVLRSMGIEICDIRVEYDNEGNVKEIYTKHRLENGLKKEITFSEESGGTRKIFSVLPMLLKGIDNGSFFVIDELDAKLHPVLLRKIIELFTDKETNKSGAQMLFTSHDLTTMSNEVFRRDEIWFSAINGYDESVLYSLVDFKKESGNKPRNDENYNKQYMEGRYGADPYMRKLQNWEVV